MFFSSTFLVVGTNEVVENNQKEKDDADEVAKHSKLNIRDHGAGGC